VVRIDGSKVASGSFANVQPQFFTSFGLSFPAFPKNAFTVQVFSIVSKDIRATRLEPPARC